ncbi:hypothetical protein PENCOP_c006G04073 [Penicillium coprophilum]|uniref:monoamine oxidase n=1 Tax=Penicillium coprophilum TaxID=36646 RepID=A0A1V6UNU4_9EURO|nr:hypothetical protein PENCOP_c006G04073 [Penicillium coprophilum]
MAQDDRAQVIVIGAGLSGLTAASELNRQGIDVITFSQGLPTVVREGRTVSLFSPSVLLAMFYLIFLDLASRIYVPQSWIALSVDRAIATFVPSEIARQLLRLLVEVSSTAELSLYSVYGFAKAIPLSGGLITMLGTEGGAQDCLVVESMGITTSMLASELSRKILTGMSVTSVSQTQSDKVTVHTASGQQFHGRKVIITVPPPMLKSITFDPPMPPERISLQKNTRMGVVYKAIAVFEQPFWREGLGGEFLVLDDPACGVFDCSSPGGPGHLCFLVAGTPARQLDALESDSRRGLLLSRLAQHLGNRVLHPVDWHEKAWHLDEYCGGGYLAYPVVGTNDGHLPMPHEPIKNLHWAGTETAQEHPGYLEGAMQSGERAANEVARALHRTHADDQKENK